MDKNIKNRWLNAFFKTILLLVAVHAILLILAMFLSKKIDVFGIPVFWPHWTSNWGNSTLALIGGVIIYFVIYYFFTEKENNRIED